MFVDSQVAMSQRPRPEFTLVVLDRMYLKGSTEFSSKEYEAAFAQLTPYRNDVLRHHDFSTLNFNSNNDLDRELAKKLCVAQLMRALCNYHIAIQDGCTDKATHLRDAKNEIKNGLNDYLAYKVLGSEVRFKEEMKALSNFWLGYIRQIETRDKKTKEEKSVSAYESMMTVLPEDAKTDVTSPFKLLSKMLGYDTEESSSSAASPSNRSLSEILICLAPTREECKEAVEFYEPLSQRNSPVRLQKSGSPQTDSADRKVQRRLSASASMVASGGGGAAMGLLLSPGKVNKHKGDPRHSFVGSKQNLGVLADASAAASAARPSAFPVSVGHTNGFDNTDQILITGGLGAAREVSHGSGDHELSRRHRLSNCANSDGISAAVAAANDATSGGSVGGSRYASPGSDSLSEGAGELVLSAGRDGDHSPSSDAAGSVVGAMLHGQSGSASSVLPVVPGAKLG
jgi:hypothetical protein